jgi:hypothetical protein
MGNQRRVSSISNRVTTGYEPLGWQRTGCNVEMRYDTNQTTRAFSRSLFSVVKEHYQRRMSHIIVGNARILG